MRIIDLETWPRRSQYELLHNWEYPHFSLCANMEITAFRAAQKARGVSFTGSMMYVIARSANAIPEFRTRIRGDEVVEHDVVHPSVTVLSEGDLFGFCIMRYDADFGRFIVDAEAEIERAKAHGDLDDGPEPDTLLFMTSIPWVSFTSMMHPLALNPADSVPRFAWGKWFEEGDCLKMPLSAQAHHALVDGVHMGRLYEKVQALFDEPESWMGVYQDE